MLWSTQCVQSSISEDFLQRRFNFATFDQIEPFLWPWNAVWSSLTTTHYIILKNWWQFSIVNRGQRNVFMPIYLVLDKHGRSPSASYFRDSSEGRTACTAQIRVIVTRRMLRSSIGYSLIAELQAIIYLTYICLSDKPSREGYSVCVCVCVGAGWGIDDDS